LLSGRQFHSRGRSSWIGCREKATLLAREATVFADQSGINRAVTATGAEMAGGGGRETIRAIANGKTTIECDKHA
jgi:hypothetical protein